MARDVVGFRALCFFLQFLHCYFLYFSETRMLIMLFTAQGQDSGELFVIFFKYLDRQKSPLLYIIFSSFGPKLQIPSPKCQEILNFCKVV